jgi:Zn-dependent protease with chaperone function
MNAQVAGAPAALPARFYDGQLSRPHMVELQIGSGGIALRSPWLQRDYDWRRASVSERLQHAPRIIRFADGTFCEIDDQQGLDAALTAVGYRDSLVARSQRRWSHVIAAMALLVVAILALYRWGLPAAAAAAARRLPPSVESEIGARATKIVERQFGPSRLPQAQHDRVERLFDSIAPHDEHRFSVVLRDGGPVGANAFALPGGTVIVTDQLVALAPDDAALQGVLAHEIGHVENRHVIRQIISSTVVGAVVTLIAGDVSGVMAALPAVLADLSYSRDMEREADAYAVRLLRDQGVAVESFAELLQRLQTAHQGNDTPGWAGYLQTHPDTADRIAAIRKAIGR